MHISFVSVFGEQFCQNFHFLGLPYPGRFFFNLGHLRFWTFFDKFWTFWKKLWTFQYAAGFRGPGILIKRFTIADLSVRRMAQRSHKPSKKGLKNIQKSIAALSHFLPFWVVKIQGGNAPPPDKNIPVIPHASHVYRGQFDLVDL